MDVSKYRTKFPPREHEEAVRMLLENLDQQAAEIGHKDCSPNGSSQTNQRPKLASQTNHNNNNCQNFNPPPNEDNLKPSRKSATSLKRRPHPTDTKTMNMPLGIASKSNHAEANSHLESSSVDSGSLARDPDDDDNDDDSEETEDEVVVEEAEYVLDDSESRERSAHSLGFNSEESGSQDFVHNIPKLIQSGRLHRASLQKQPLEKKFFGGYEDDTARYYPLPKMHSKATSTTSASDSLLTNGASSGDNQTHRKFVDGLADGEDLNGNYEAIPSRTIAIQCDLKLSSVKRDGVFFDSASNDIASMQASSISSTRYGFYRLSPEIIEQRRQLARSVSSRNIAHSLSPLSDGAAPLREGVEPTTSISGRSLSATSSSSSSNSAANDSRLASEQIRDSCDAPPKTPSVLSHNTEFENRNKRDQRFFSQRRQQQQQSNSRARLDSLPRRPKTALSYVSSSRLREASEPHQRSGQAHSELDDSEQQIEDKELRISRSRALSLARDRAMSQQTLTSQTLMAEPRQSVAIERLAKNSESDHLSSNSDGELAAERKFVSQLDEMAATRRSRTIGSSPQVSRRSNFKFGHRGNSLLKSSGESKRRTAVTTSELAPFSATETNGLAHSDVDYKPRIASRDRQNSCKEPRKQLGVQKQQISLDRVKSNQDRYSTDEENLLSASMRQGTLTHTRQQPFGANDQLNSRQTLLRKAQQHQFMQSSQPKLGDYNLSTDERNRQAEAPGEESDADHSLEPPISGHNSKQRNHQHHHLPLTRAQSTSRPLTTTVTQKLHQMPSASSFEQAHIGRSTSMKQPERTRWLPKEHFERAPGDDFLGSELEASRTLADHNKQSQSSKYCDCSAYDCQESSDDQMVHAAAEISAQTEGQLQKHSIRMPAESEDSGSPSTRTWANPASTRRCSVSKVNHHHLSTNDLHLQPTKTSVHRATSTASRASKQLTGMHATANNLHKSSPRKNARSHSMRDVNSFDNPNSTAAINRSTRQQRLDHNNEFYQAGGLVTELDNEYDELPNENDVRMNELHERRFKRQSNNDEGNDDDELSDECLFQSSSSMDGGRLETLTRAHQANHRPLDFDSQQRLNEIGLPETNHSMQTANMKRQTLTSSASHLGLPSGHSSGLNRFATIGRSTQATDQQLYNQHSRSGPAITGRALSQQSLTRPTMPLSRRLRRSGNSGGVSSGSDVGGSSMSLVSRFRDGSRYENAHTRTPVVMLIPQVTTTRQSEPSRNVSLGSSKRGSSRFGSRTWTKTPGLRVSSQDRKGRSLSRNGSDSESSSSMLRTLVKPRSSTSRGSINNRSSRRRGPRNNNPDLDEENLDEIGQLATEIDSYKFRRRYSVPKDAKINWFSKLKQRVTSPKN